MIDRRSLIVSGTALFLTRKLRSQCGPVACSASVNFQNLTQSITTQQCAEWCWAASIAMILTFHGHPIDQKQIVAQTYGAVVCLPSGANAVMGNALSRPYIDANGKGFRCKVTAAFDPQNGIANLNNTMIVNELLQNRPLIVCNTHHAMVVCGVDYVPNGPYPPIITNVYVVDPWPYFQRIHPLPAPEMVPYGMFAAPGVPGQMMFLAAVATT